MITSVLELSRYNVGDTAYWVILRGKELKPLDDEQKWMEEHHPKVLYDSQGPWRSAWPYRALLPKLHHMDFTEIIALLTSDFVIEEFTIVEVIRSSDTAEFFYSNQDDEWMPESCLFDTDVAARRERSRILKLLQKWSQRQV